MKKFPAVLLLFLVLHCVAGAASNEWVHWPVSGGGNGHYYRAIRTPSFVSWTTADALARNAGSHLATITSAAENAFVYTLIESSDFWNGQYGPVFGGYQPPGSTEPAGGWTWVTGEPWEFSNWAGNQPDNGDNPSEDGIHFVRNGPWNDIRTNVAEFVSYVIERETPPQPLVSIRISQVEVSWFAESGKIYELQYRSELTTNAWVPLSNPIVGTGGNFSAVDAVRADSPERLYRVVTQ